VNLRSWCFFVALKLKGPAGVRCKFMEHLCPMDTMISSIRCYVLLDHQAITCSISGMNKYIIKNYKLNNKTFEAIFSLITFLVFPALVLKSCLPGKKYMLDEQIA